MEKQTLLCVMIFISSFFLCYASRPVRELNAKPQDLAGFYGNPNIPPDFKNFMHGIIPYIPNPPEDPFFPPDPTDNDPPSFNPNPPPTNPSPVPPTTPKKPTPTKPTPVPPSTPAKPPPSKPSPSPPSSGGGDDGGNVPIVFNGSGGGYYNGQQDNWWYKVDANGNVYTSPNFFDDPAVPDFVKQQVQNVSNYYKNGSHP